MWIWLHMYPEAKKISGFMSHVHCVFYNDTATYTVCVLYVLVSR